MIPELQIPASELRNRIANKQIRLNDEPIGLQTYRQLNLESAVELGEWLFNHPDFSTIARLSNIYSVEVMADCNCIILQEIFKGKAILQISKKYKFIINDILDNN